MPDDAQPSTETSTQSLNLPGTSPHDAVTGKFQPIEMESTGKYRAIDESDGETRHQGETSHAPTDPIHHELSSGPPAIPGYDIVGELGRGGMGVVYKAWHTTSKRFVALKMIRTGAEAKESRRKRFRLESEAVAKLSHPNIIQIYEVGEFEQHPFFSLEFCSGGSLAKKLSGAPMLPQAAAQVVEKLARAVAVAHAQQIIHRDLKPANILLSSEGEPKISDFGLAKRLDSDDPQSRAGAVLGTPSYMPPEQAIGAANQIGPAADIYALGAILYECLTGRPPFRSATAIDTLDQVRHQDPVAPRLLNATVPAELDTICLKCLRKSPAQRYATAAALADDLHRFLSGMPIVARPPGWSDRLIRWMKRNPLAAAGVTLLTLAILFAAVMGIFSALK